MESLYTISTVFNENNFVHFYNELTANVSKKSIVWLNVCYVILILLFALAEFRPLIENGNFPYLTILFVLLLCYYDYRYFSRTQASKIGKKIYQSWKMVHEEIYKYEFFEHEFVVTFKYGYTKLPYSMLYEIRETKNQYVILESSGSGYFIEKSDTQDGFSDFVKKVKNTYSI